MIRETLGYLSSSLPKDRALGWKLAWQNRAELRGIAPEHKEQLLTKFMANKDPETIYLATATLLAIMSGELPVPPAGDQVKLLGNWLWSSFQAPSIVFSTTETGTFRRDESAEVCVAQRLGSDRGTKFEQVLLQCSEWQELLSKSPHRAACFIGRFGLYGDKAPDRLVHPQARLEFPEQSRPPHLKPNEIDDEHYHCIFERLGKDAVDKYKTIAEQGKRIDYALVQRYPRRWNHGKIIVVNLAGCTSLGTYAAASWAAEKLFEPVDSTGSRIECPPGIAEGSIFEALLRVTAAETGRRWRAQEIEVLRLFVDGRCWSPDALAWEEVQINEICLKIHDDGTFTFLFDGRPSRIKQDGTYGRLLAAMVRQKSQHGRDAMDLAELASDPSIWGQASGKVQVASIKKVHTFLKNLRNRHLHSALTVRKEVAYLHPKVRIDGCNPAAAWNLGDLD